MLVCGACTNLKVKSNTFYMIKSLLIVLVSQGNVFMHCVDMIVWRLFFFYKKFIDLRNLSLLFFGYEKRYFNCIYMYYICMYIYVCMWPGYACVYGLYDLNW